MNVNIETVFHDFLKNNFLDLCGLWFVRQHTIWLCQGKTTSCE